MTKAEILAFIKNCTACFLATTEGDTPHVRGMGVCRADENGIILYTAKNKAVYQQIVHNPKVEICFYDSENRAQVRVSGKMEIVEDMALKQEIGATRPRAIAKVAKDGYDWMVVFRLRNGIASAWSSKLNINPKTLVDL